MKQIGVIATCVAPEHRRHQYCYDLAGKAGRTCPLVRSVTLWAWRKIGTYALRNEAAYARYYKYMATRPLLHDTHLPLAELRTTYSQTNILNFAYIMGITAHWATFE